MDFSSCFHRSPEAEPLQLFFTWPFLQIQIHGFVGRDKKMYFLSAMHSSNMPAVLAEGSPLFPTHTLWGGKHRAAQHSVVHGSVDHEGGLAEAAGVPNLQQAIPVPRGDVDA